MTSATRTTRRSRAFLGSAPLVWLLRSEVPLTGRPRARRQSRSAVEAFARQRSGNDRVRRRRVRRRQNARVVRWGRSGRKRQLPCRRSRQRAGPWPHVRHGPPRRRLATGRRRRRRGRPRGPATARTRSRDVPPSARRSDRLHKTLQASTHGSYDSGNPLGASSVPDLAVATLGRLVTIPVLPIATICPRCTPRPSRGWPRSQ